MKPGLTQVWVVFSDRRVERLTFHELLPAQALSTAASFHRHDDLVLGVSLVPPTSALLAVLWREAAL